MAVIKRLTRLGDSRAVVLPKPFLDQLNIDELAEVELSLEEGRIVIEPHRYATDAEFKASAARVAQKHKKALERLAK